MIKKILNRVFFILFLTLLVSILTECSIKKHLIIDGLSLKLKYPVFSEDSLYYFNKEVLLYSFDSANLIMIPYYYNLTINDNNVKNNEIRYQYFLYYKSIYHATNGILFDLNQPKLDIKIHNRDTILNKQIFAGFPWNKALADFKLQKSRKINNDLEEDIYVPKNNLVEEDSLILKYSKNYTRYDYSFSKFLDSLKTSKLILISYIYNADFSKNYNMFLPTRKVTFEMTTFSIKEEKEIINLFRKYQEFLWNANNQ